jgi:hypothetical protein
MNMYYISRLTDEKTEEYNTDEYMLLYLSISRNIKVYFSIIPNQRIY